MITDKWAIAHSNLVDDASLSGGSWNSTWNLEKLKKRELALYALSASGAAADCTILFDHTTSESARFYGIFGHSCNNTSITIRIRRSDLTPTGSEIYDSGVLPCWAFVPMRGYTGAGAHFGIFVMDTVHTSARYTSIVIDASAYGAIRIGRPFIGPVFEPTYNPSYGRANDGWMEPNSRIVRAESGTDWPTKRREMRSVAYDMSFLSPSEASQFHEIQRLHSIVDEVVHIPNTTDRAIMQQYGFLGVMKKLSALEHPFYNHRAIAVAIDERGGAV